MDNCVSYSELTVALNNLLNINDTSDNDNLKKNAKLLIIIIKIFSFMTMQLRCVLCFVLAPKLPPVVELVTSNFEYNSSFPETQLMVEWRVSFYLYIRIPILIQTHSHGSLMYELCVYMITNNRYPITYNFLETKYSWIGENHCLIYLI